MTHKPRNQEGKWTHSYSYRLTLIPKETHTSSTGTQSSFIPVCNSIQTHSHSIGLGL